MSLFSESEVITIQEALKEAKENLIITFRQKHGPTKLRALWHELLMVIGRPSSCISWWSSAGVAGLLECDIPDGPNIYGQWILDDENKLMGVFSVGHDEVVDIRAGFDAGNVVDPAMRAIRIGESGGELE